MTEPEDSPMPRIVTADILLIRAIRNMFFNADDSSNGRKLNVAEIIAHLRSIEYKFSNDRIHEIISNLDGVIIKRTGDSKGSTKEYELITEPKDYDHVRYAQMIHEAEDDNLAIENLVSQMDFFGILYNKIIKHDKNDQEGMNVLLQDVCLLLVSITRQKNSIKDSGEKTSSFQNMKNHLVTTEDILTRRHRELVRIYPQIKQFKKDYEELDSGSLNLKFQHRMLYHTEHPE